MGFEQLAALRDQLAAQAAEQQRQSPQRKDSSKPRRNPSSDKTPPRTAGQGQAPSQGQPRRQQAPRRPAQQSRPEPVDPVVQAISKLQRQFPQAFPKKPAPKVPLKLGIHRDLYAQSDSLQLEQPQIKEAIQAWCQGSRYWACLVQDAARLDLTGAQDGTVTAEEAKRARQLAGRQRWQARNAKKQADKPGQPEDAPTDPATATDSVPGDNDPAALDTPNTADAAAPVTPASVPAPAIETATQPSPADPADTDTTR